MVLRTPANVGVTITSMVRYWPRANNGEKRLVSTGPNAIRILQMSTDHVHESDAREAV